MRTRDRAISMRSFRAVSRLIVRVSARGLSLIQGGRGGVVPLPAAREASPGGIVGGPPDRALALTASVLRIRQGHEEASRLCISWEA